MSHSSGSNNSGRPGQAPQRHPVMDIRYISNAGAINLQAPQYSVASSSRPPVSPYPYISPNAPSYNVNPNAPSHSVDPSSLSMRVLGAALPPSRPSYSVSYAPQYPPPGAPPNNMNYYATASGSNIPRAPPAGSPINNNYAAATSSNTPRAPRPSYSEEQKFYIMYARIIRDWSWPVIEENFTRIFDGRNEERAAPSGTPQQRAANTAAQRNERSKGGLTSVYYRIRRSWGLPEVLKGQPETFANDKRVVHYMARNFSEEFLRSIGYLQ